MISHGILLRRLFLLRAEGGNNVWHNLSPEVSHLFCSSCTNPSLAYLLAQSRIRASLFNFNLPLDFAAVWLRERPFEQKPEMLTVPVAPTREFCFAFSRPRLRR
jgi:hypothetical protein